MAGEITFKGRKYYGVVSKKYGPNSEYISWPSGDIEKSKIGLKDKDDILVEMEVVKVFVKETDVKEIENEPTEK